MRGFTLIEQSLQSRYLYLIMYSVFIDQLWHSPSHPVTQGMDTVNASLPCNLFYNNNNPYECVQQPGIHYARLYFNSTAASTFRLRLLKLLDQSEDTRSLVSGHGPHSLFHLLVVIFHSCRLIDFP